MDLAKKLPLVSVEIILLAILLMGLAVPPFNLLPSYLMGTAVSPLLDMPVAQRNAERYIQAIARSDAVAAKQACASAKSDEIAQQIDEFGGAEVRDIKFHISRLSGGSFGPSTVLDVAFSYRHPGQANWQQGTGRMTWAWYNGPEAWRIPSPGSCTRFS